jgi:hypothetical protein
MMLKFVCITKSLAPRGADGSTQVRRLVRPGVCMQHQVIRCIWHQVIRCQGLADGVR